jgi:ATP-dependent DNA helicase RecQ
LIAINERAQGRSSIEHALESCENDEKVLVFCERKLICDQLSEIYNDAPKYYSDAVNKKDALKRWNSGLMLATGALGVGMDIQKILWVFHWGLPFGMVEFDQEVGRGGRGGEIVRSVILLSESVFRQQLHSLAGTLPANQSAMREYIITFECRRKRLSSFMDGEDNIHDCEGINGEICDRCGGIVNEIERRTHRLMNVEEASLFYMKITNTGE